MPDPDFTSHQHKSRDDLIRELLETHKQVAEFKEELLSLSRDHDLQRHDCSENETKFSALVEPWAQAVWEADSHGMTVSDSPTWRAYTGQTKEELLSADGWKKVIYPDDQEYAFKKWKESVRTRKPMDAIFRLRRSDGSYRWTNVRAAPLMDTDGFVLKWVGMNIDVHDRKTAEEALRESEMQFRQLADAMPQLVWTAGPDGSVRYVNERRREYKQIETKEDGTFDWTVLLHEDDREQTIQAWQDAFQRGVLYQVEHRLCCADQTYHWHLSRAMPVRDSEGRVDKWFGTATDIDTIKQAETFQRHLNTILEEKVAERTKIAEARAKQLQSLAVELVQAEEFERQRIADLLHDDLQQMIASARIQVQMASRNKDPGPILETVEQLLALSIEKSRRLSHELSPPVLQHFGLADALTWLARHMEEQFGLDVHLEITVNKHELKKDEPLKERAAAIGGNLDIDSAPGRGSRFTLEVPNNLFLPGKPEKQGQLTLPSDLRGKPITVLESEVTRVLFVDDHRVMRQGLISMIADQPGIRVVGEAESGEEAFLLPGSLHSLSKLPPKEHPDWADYF